MLARYRVLLFCLLVGAACLAHAEQSAMRTSAVAPMTGFADFQAYAQASRNRIQETRDFQTENPGDELNWNSPFERRPDAPSRKAMLLIHGLGDSPWSFVDIAQDLVAQGYVVRTLLLPGHGTRPADLIDVRLEEWQQLVREQVALLHRDFPEVYLGGFSTGANLALEYAVGDPQVRGLLLFSPALRSNEYFAWVTPWLAHVRTWLLSTGPHPQQSPLRYHNVPTNGFAQFHRSSVAARRAIRERDFDRPVVMVLAEHDSVVDVRYVRRAFDRHFTHAASRLIWYGRVADDAAASPRILERTDFLPQERISQFSHMGILFSPQNALYGRSGSERICWNGQTDEATARCLSGEPVWYSDWDYREKGKVHARLTFNPYFDWQSRVIREVLASTSDLAMNDAR
ncbi:alpha/beta hydrolase [Billgrantia endophytica]|nr:alpha/beta fold hydrolase [Halomonas endophytica]